MSKENNTGGAVLISWGKYGGFYIHWGYTKRLCLGWIAFTYYPTDPDNLFNEPKTPSK